MTTLHEEELDAAIAEGLLPIDNDPIIMQLVFAYKEQRRAAKMASDRKGEIGNQLMKALTDKGAQAFTIGGQPFARVQHSRTVSLDVKRVKEERPDVYAEYSKVTETQRLWVRPQDGDDV